MSDTNPELFIGDIGIDLCLSEKFTEAVITTDHPVEEGADPTDHARKKPGMLMIEGFITNTPIPYSPSRGPIQDGRLGYATRVYKQLQDLVMGKAMTVETSAKVYKNMQITELARSRDSKLGTDSIQFTIQFKEIIFVSTETVRLEQVTKPTAIPKKPTGKVKQSKQPAEEKRQSILDKDVFHPIAGWLGANARGPE